MKRVILLFLLLTLPFPSTSHAQNLKHPPIPQESPTTEKIAIVLLKEPKTKAEIQQLINRYPNLELRHVFQHALTGFSVKGSLETLNQLAQDNKMLTVSPVNEYQVTSDENIKIIGGDKIRGYFDNHHHRLTGEGVTVGVIDTGIDYTHPDLRNSYAGGRDLVDGDKDPMETQSEALGTFHGTHVAGIIAANGKIKGVAPEAKVIAYRALGPGGSGTTEQVIAAIDQAIKDKVDILNLSLGNSINGPDLPISLALNKAVDHGIVAVTSSGNSGPKIWTVGSPGTASKAISVGASTPPLMTPFLKVEGLQDEIRMDYMNGSKEWNFDRAYEIAFGGLGKKKELKNVRGKIVLIERGEITFTNKAKNAQEAGAVAVIIYNNTKGTFIGNLDQKVSIPVTTLSGEKGRTLRKMIQHKALLVRTHLIEEKDLLADFSSRGPVTSTWEIKPDMVAPGVAINSTVPGGYLALQGTSMAAPHVAGACALIKQAHPDWGPSEIKAALMNTAMPITNKAGRLYRTFEQGAGRIRIEEAVNAETIALPGSLQFGKFKINDKMHEHRAFLTVKNVDKRTKTYSFSIPQDEEGIDWEMPFSFQLPPDKEKKVEIKMSVDPRAFKKKLHDGYIVLNAGSKQIQIPYIYVLEEPEYPRVMGFASGIGDKEGTYRYEVYLPGGAEEFGIALFDPDTYRFIGYLDWKRKIGRGHLKEEIKIDQLPEDGMYLAKVFAKKAGKEDMIQTMIYISRDGRYP